MADKNKILKDTYYNPKSGLVSGQRLYEKVKSKGITLKQVKEWLSKQRTEQVTKVKKKPAYIPIVGEPGSYQGDLMFLDKYAKENKGYSVVLCFIEITSRKAYTYALKNKSGPVVFEGFKQFLKDTGGNVKNLTTDNGVEFKNTSMDDLTDQKEINHEFAQPGDHTRMGKVERFNRTLRGLINKYMTAHQTHEWVSVLPDLTDNYNNAIHSRTKIAPNNVGARQEVEINLKERQKGEEAIREFESYKIGDRVRVLRDKALFDKGFRHYSKSIYTIDDIAGYHFIVRNDRGELKAKHYKARELQKVDSDVQDIEPAPKPAQSRKEIKTERKYKRDIRKAGVNEADILPETEKRQAQPAQRYIFVDETKKQPKEKPDSKVYGEKEVDLEPGDLVIVADNTKQGWSVAQVVSLSENNMVKIQWYDKNSPTGKYLPAWVDADQDRYFAKNKKVVSDMPYEEDVPRDAIVIWGLQSLANTGRLDKSDLKDINDFFG